MVVKVYSIQVSGIKCTNCAGKIERGLIQSLGQEIAKVSVNITIQNDIVLEKVLKALQILGYPSIGQPIMISGGDSSMRIVSFSQFSIQNKQAILNQLKQSIGVEKVVSQSQQKKITITYNCQIVKGRQLGDIVNKYSPGYKVINHRVQSFQCKKQNTQKKINLLLTFVLCGYFLVFNMILPFTGSWFTHIMMFPQSLGIYSFYIILNIFVTLYVLQKYALRFIKNAYKNYVQFRQTDMETLIALGSMSAFGLFLFFMIRYTYQSLSSGVPDMDEALMNIADALTSASIIVLVVTIGKHYENKIKMKIERITAQIFPQSTLFNQMNVQYVELKNRKLAIKQQRQYDVTLIQKDDILNLKPGRLLVDVVVISGTIKATQSAINGSEDIKDHEKGSRIQSGAIIHENINSLVQVQNIFEKSILIQIGTQIKLAQNQQESSKDGIQAVCKTISSYFVRGVIILSILVMIVWIILLYWNFVQVNTCNICWIVERGIGVLVASCPCALGLAVPSVIAIILNLATKSGILIRNNTIFQKMKKCNKISFDKTGTLFTRIEKIQKSIIFSHSIDESNMWEIIALVQKQIRHPLAQILYKEALNRCNITGTNFNFNLVQKPHVQKQGIKSIIQDKSTKQNLEIRIGNKNLLKNNNINAPFFEKQSNAATQLFLCINQEACMVIFLNTHSNLRPQAQDVIRLIQQQNKQIHILSGDSFQSVQKLGNYLGISSACLHPEQSAFMKMDWIKSVQSDGHQVMMVGDGLNDIPCLQEAGIGISINAKSQLNINAANVVIMSENLYKILALIRLIKKGNLFIKINLFWAFSYNIIMMPVVAGALYPLGIFISPVWSSIAMSLSSILVVLFSQLLVVFNYDESLNNNRHDMKGISMQDLQNLTQTSKNSNLTDSTKAHTNKKNYIQFNDQIQLTAM